MLVDSLAENAQIFLLILARVVDIVQIAPLLSSASIPQIAKIGLAFFASLLVFPWVVELGYPIPGTGLEFAGLLIGELLIGVIIAFMLVVIYSAFLIAGQFFSLQMGFGASEVFDPLAQIQIPLMGQFLNIIAMFTFIVVGGFQKIFLVGIYRSFQAAKAYDFIAHKDYILSFMIRSLGSLFEQALLIAFPILGTLMLVSVTMGLLAKAAPQMNMLMLGFPIAILVAFTVLFLTLPFLIEGFEKVIDESFVSILTLLDRVKGGP